jgi:predicted esterase
MILDMNLSFRSRSTHQCPSWRSSRVLLLSGCLLLAGCTVASTEDEAAEGERVAKSLFPMPEILFPGLTVPVLSPKPVVWINDWEHIGEWTEARKDAAAFLYQADSHKAAMEFEEAERFYLRAIESTEPTHRELQAILNSPLFESILNRDKVFLFGYSQSGSHVMLLTAEMPEIYAGVISLSPGGSLSHRLAPPPLDHSKRSARCMFIYGTQEPHAPLARVWATACSAAGWKFETKTHPGGHRIPKNWAEMQADAARFLTE